MNNKMSKEVKILLSISLTIEVNEGIDVRNIIQELDYDFDDTTGASTIVDTEIIDFDIIDGK